MKHRHLTAWILGCLFVTSCKTVDQDESQVKVSPPADMSRTIRCDLGNHPDGAQAVFDGRPIRYYNSSEIPYNSKSWYDSGDKPWISFDAFHSGNIGYPGYPSSTRSGVAPSGIHNVRLAVVDVRLVNGKPHYHYFSNETALNPIENWSSTKAPVMTMAADTIRKASDGKVGLLSQTGGNVWVGTHVTTVARTSDNGTAVWFKSITGGQESHQLFQSWLARWDPTQSFGGGHGAAARNLGKTFRAENGSSVTIPKAGSFVSYGVNTLKPIMMAEFWKRLAVNHDDPSIWLTDIQDDDLIVLKYGYKSGRSNGGLLYGATKNDGFINAFGGKTRLDQISPGWRIFGKTGSGYSNERGRHEAAIGGYLCIPKNNSAGIEGGRLLAYFMNIQAESNAKKYQIRNAVAAKLTNLMVPEIRNARDLWQSAPATRRLTANATTFFKISPDQSSTLSDGSQKCVLQAGQSIELDQAVSLAPSGHTAIKLKNALPGCDFTEGYIYGPHF